MNKFINKIYNSVKFLEPIGDMKNKKKYFKGNTFSDPNSENIDISVYLEFYWNDLKNLVGEMLNQIEVLKVSYCQIVHLKGN